MVDIYKKKLPTTTFIEIKLIQNLKDILFSKKCVLFFQTEEFMLSLYNSMTEYQSDIFEQSLSEQQLTQIRNNPFHFTDSNIQVSWFFLSFFVIFMKICVIINHE